MSSLPASPLGEALFGGSMVRLLYSDEDSIKDKIDSLEYKMSSSYGLTRSTSDCLLIQAKGNRGVYESVMQRHFSKKLFNQEASSGLYSSDPNILCPVALNSSSMRLGGKMRLFESETESSQSVELWSERPTQIRVSSRAPRDETAFSLHSINVWSEGSGYVSTDEEISSDANLARQSSMLDGWLDDIRSRELVDYKFSN